MTQHVSKLLHKTCTYLNKNFGGITLWQYENNLIDVQALGEAKSIDFANKMGDRLNKLFTALGITNKIPMNVGSALKQYRFNVIESEAPNGDVAEGEVIPLTKVES